MDMELGVAYTLQSKERLKTKQNRNRWKETKSKQVEACPGSGPCGDPGQEITLLLIEFSISSHPKSHTDGMADAMG